MAEKWERWEPIRGLSNKYYIESISDSIDGFLVVLSDSSDVNKKVEVFFEDSVRAHRSTYESFMLSTIYTLDERYGTDFYTGHTFFKIANSEYIEWLAQQSYRISESESLVHFCMLAVDSVLDVLAAYEPKVIMKGG